ncbi:PorV/PorQ family protein [bacterium]|nr:PorV/PorQ family protein [bacterium]
MQRFFCTIKLVALLLFALSLSSEAGEEEVGTSAASFLKIGIGARATGMGEAACAVADDPTAIYWNPAGLAGIRSKQLTYGHNIYLNETTAGFIGLVHPFKDFSLGLGIDYLKLGEAEKTTELKPTGTGEKFSVEDDMAIFLSLSRRMREGLFVGMNLKYIRQKIEDESATGFGADLGVLYLPSKLRLGITVQNIGPKLKFIEKDFSLPLNLKAGIAYPYKNFLFALDANKPADNRMSFSLGIESYWARVLALRLGYRIGPDDKLKALTNTPVGLSAGVGFKFKTFQLDAAYVPYGDLGDAYRVSLLSRFGGEKGRRKEEAQILALGVTDNGDYTRDKTRLYAFWDEVLKAKEYQYSIGTSPGTIDVLGWTSAGREIRVDATGLNLTDGQTYYVSVKAKKRRILVFPYWQASGSSDGITVDSISPDEPVVTDDGVYTTDNKELHFKWSSSDQVSGIKDYLYALGTTPKGADALNWRSVDPKTELTLTDLNLKDGQTCYLFVKATDNAGNESEIGSSDGITVDTTAPVLTTITDGGEYTTDKTRLSFTFSFEDKESEIEEYQYTVGTFPEGVEVITWKSTTETKITESDLNLINGQTYYLTVQAKNKAGLWSRPESSDGIMVETTPPSTPVVTDDGDTTTDTASLHFRCSSKDNESGIIEYQYGIGTSPEGTDVVGWTASKETETEVTGLSLLVDQTYYISVKARNKAGLWSEVGTSEGITITRTPEPELTGYQSPVTTYRSGKENLRMTALVYEDQENVKLYVHLKNIGDKDIYTALSDFILSTEDSQAIRPDISKTYTTDNHFSSGFLSSSSEAEGFIIFKTKEIPKTLTYEGLLGNKVSIDLP